MSFIGIKVPHEVGRMLQTIEVPGEKVATEEYHITLLYIGKEVPIEMIGKAIVAAAEVAESWKPFRCTLTHATAFPKNPDGVPIICPVLSDELHALNKRMREAFDEAGVEYSKKYPDYKPHVTLAYEEEEGFKKKDFWPLEWSVYELVLWGGDAGEDRLAANFPFAMPTKAATNQHLVRLAMALQKKAQEKR